MTDDTGAGKPKVRVLEIDLSKLTSTARLIPPVELAAMTAATVCVIEETIRQAPDDVESMLLGAWQEVAQRIYGRPAPGRQHSAQLLHEYFTHHGDWAAMGRCLKEAGEQQQSRPGEFAELLAQHLEQAREEYRKLFAASRPGA